jgi:hypothetical protein
MQALSNAIYAALSGSAALTAKLGTFDGGPAIFTQEPIPDAATRPVVLASRTISDEPDDPIGQGVEGRIIARDIAVYGSATANFRAVVEAAEIIRGLIHRKRIVVSGWQTVIVLASGPVVAPVDGPQEIGRLITAIFRLRRFL